jgi:MFS family permease
MANKTKNIPHGGAPVPHLFSALAYQEYRLFWIGGAFSNLGMWALVFGRLWLMHSITQSPIMLGAVTISSLGPVLILSPLGGVIADRVNRLKLVTWTRGGFAILALLTALLITLSLIRPWHLLAISVATGILIAFDMPSRQAILPNLVPRVHLVNAITIYSFVTAGSAIIGPSIFAPLVKFAGLQGLFGLIGIAYLLTIVMLTLMKPLPQTQAVKEGGLLRGLRDGFQYIRVHPHIPSILTLGLLGGVFGLSFETLLPVFAGEILHGGVDTYGSLLLASGIGGIVGTFILVKIANLRNSAFIHLIAGIGLGISLISFSQISFQNMAIGVMGLVGMFSTMFLTINNTMVQSVVKEDFRGRVMSFHQLTWGITAVGGFLMGFIAQISNAPQALLIGGFMTGIGTILISVRLIKSWGN